MAHHRLADGISFCDIEGRLVLLDLARDRYFILGPAADRAFRSLLAGGEGVECDLEILRAARLIVDAQSPGPILGARAAVPSRSLVERRHAGARARVGLLPQIVARLWAARIGAGGARLRRTISALRAAKERALPSHVPAEALVPAYAATRRLLPLAPNCLRDSLALAFHLARRGAAFELVIGVKLDPFAAHCWLQDGQLVLNDSLDSVADFRPILVV